LALRQEIKFSGTAYPSGAPELTPTFKWGSSATKLSSSHHKVMCSQQDIAEEEFEATKGRQSESVYRRRTDNTMAKRKCTKNEQFFNYIMAATRYI
jgi:hypothetical protein